MKKSNIAWLTTLTSLALTYGLATSSPAPGNYQESVGLKSCCVCRGHATLEGYGTVEAHGQVFATWTANSNEGDPNIWSQLEVVDFNNTQTNPELGTLSWTLDNQRAYTSSIRSDHDGEMFPATATIGWYANMEVEDRHYRTMEPIVMQATITGWPNNDTHYEQVGAVNLERVDNPGEIALTLSGMDTHVTQVQ